MGLIAAARSLLRRAACSAGLHHDEVEVTVNSWVYRCSDCGRVAERFRCDFCGKPEDECMVQCTPSEWRR